jgi:hypothetical protein
VAAPSADHTWLPGSWAWQQNRYAWRPGYWATGQSDWSWVPAHYVWTPRGYVFVDGYYDYSVARRGVLFAPVYFNSAIYSQPGFSYSPAMAISPAIFGSHLFLRPSYGHYYYGDYYGLNYASAGYSPWFSFNSSRYGYDPFYAQQRWINRQNVGWNQNLQTNFQNLRANETLRPPRTWAEQNARLASAGAQNGQNAVVAASLSDLAKNKDHALRLQQVDQAEQQQHAQHGQAVTQLRDQRQKLELQAGAPLAGKTTTAHELQPTKGALSRSPIVALPANQLGKDHTPPQRHEVLKPDLTIAPTARDARATPNSAHREPVPATGAPRAEPPKTEPQKSAKAESKGPPADRPNSQPQRAPQGKPQGEAKNKAKN